MGQLFQGVPLSWEESQKHADYIREHGIIQFLNVWKKEKGRQNDPFLWGDEIESIVISYDDENKNARLSLRQSEVLGSMRKDNGAPPVAEGFQPEYSRFMVETTPESPYSSSVESMLSVEPNMQQRRKFAKTYLKSYETVMSLTSYPRLGVLETFTDPPTNPANANSSHSLFLPEEITNSHPRYKILTRNVRQRKGSKPTANVPIYHDTNTPRPFHDPTIPQDRDIYPEDSEARDGAAKPDHVYLDAIGFGAGCCCLQVTFQAPDVATARTAYDALVPITPILMAMTASSPAYRGYLSDVDCRWSVLESSIDDRTREERGLEPLKNKHVIPKSRYSTVDMYISQDPANKPEYNDIPVPFDQKIYSKLRQNNLDDLLAKHFAHIFIRDPICVFSNPSSVDDLRSTDHFDNLQGTVWQSLRFKPPPLDAANKIGWRVEFRTMEVQPTDFENAAFAMFVSLLARAILSQGLNFYMPISRVDENMKRAQKRDAVRTERFWFRNGEGQYEELTIDEIINGKGLSFPGLLGYVSKYLDTLDETPEEKFKLKPYLELIKARADGTVQTPATWIRNFVRAHPAYKLDSVLSQEINYDLIKALEEVERGARKAEFLPSTYRGPKPVPEL